MEDETRVPGSFSGEPTCSLGVSSFWLDACEDISCDLINDFVDFHAPGASVEHTSDQQNLANDFFGGIDHILDTIKNGGSLSPVACNGDRDCTMGEGFCIENHASGVRDMLVDTSTVQSSGGQIDGLQCNGLSKDNFDNGSHICERYESDNGFKQPNGGEGLKVGESPNRNGVQRHEQSNNVPLRDWGCDSEERSNKRPRISNGNNERHYSNRGQCASRDREKFHSRKKLRERDEIDRRDKGYFRRREHSGTGGRDARDRDWREREQKGYWERDKSGSEMVFHSGLWEADRTREAMTASDINLEFQGTAEKSSLEIKEKIPEEKARQYQLDVLEQAKKKNTIAFLETGAGKTLIAVLLIKSIYSDLQTQNKRMLAVFLVPKVPLVYQVKQVTNVQYRNVASASSSHS